MQTTSSLRRTALLALAALAAAPAAPAASSSGAALGAQATTAAPTRVSKEQPPAGAPKAPNAPNGARTGALDRSKAPTPGPTPALRVPAIEMRTLSNGIAVAVLENHELPVVTVRAVLDLSTLLDPAGKEGLTGLTLQMLGEGTRTRTADELADAYARLGSTVSPTGFLTITPNLDSALVLMREQLWEPAFPQASLDRIRANQIAGLRRAKEQPAYLASRVLANALYGQGHPYERTTTEQSLAAITRDDLVAFHADYVRPQNVKLVVAGDITPARAVAVLEQALGAWPAGGKKASYQVATPSQVGRTTIYLYDRPGSAQSAIVAGAIGPRRDVPEFYALDLANTVLGGSFLSRLNMNLREQHGYAYGAGSGFTYRKRPELGQFTASANVQTDKTDSALVELMKEVRGTAGERPITQEELRIALSNAVKALPLRFETVGQIAGAAATVLADSLPLDYYRTLSGKYTSLSLADVNAAAKRYIDPQRLAIVIVGDRKQIEEKLRATGIAPVVVVDEQAKPVTAPATGAAAGAAAGATAGAAGAGETR